MPTKESKDKNPVAVLMINGRDAADPPMPTGIQRPGYERPPNIGSPCTHFKPYFQDKMLQSVETRTCMGLEKSDQHPYDRQMKMI